MLKHSRTEKEEGEREIPKEWFAYLEEDKNVNINIAFTSLKYSQNILNTA